MTAATPFCIAILLAVQAPSGESREIAFSYDDPPWRDTAIMTGVDRTEALIAALDEADVEGAAFFAVTERIDASGAARLRAYAKAGHVIANHSHSHMNLHTAGVDAFLDDVRTADSILRAHDGFRPWFRFPYLNHGSDTAQRDAARSGLAELGYTIGYVTVDNFDFYLDRLANDAVAAGQSVDWEGLRELYVGMLADAAEHYDAIARRHLGRSPRHVLLLHENDLAAMFSDDLARKLRTRGWTIIPAERAYEDPIAAMEPDTLYLGQGRVAALAHARGVPATELRPATEATDALREAFAPLISAPSPARERP